MPAAAIPTAEAATIPVATRRVSFDRPFADALDALNALDALDGGFLAAERLICGFFFADVFIGVFLHWICQTDEIEANRSRSFRQRISHSRQNPLSRPTVGHTEPEAGHRLEQNYNHEVPSRRWGRRGRPQSPNDGRRSASTSRTIGGGEGWAGIAAGAVPPTIMVISAYPKG
jgi:hypothetical protein